MLENAIPKVTCIYCGSSKIEMEIDDREYYDDCWLFCKDCEESFDDKYGYIDACNRLDQENWFDILEIIEHFEPDRVTADMAWQKYCEKEILKMLKEGLQY